MTNVQGIAGLQGWIALPSHLELRGQMLMRQREAERLLSSQLVRTWHLDKVFLCCCLWSGDFGPSLGLEALCETGS